jgi:hypothetical protein
MQSNRSAEMKRKLFLASFTMLAMFAGGAVSHAANAMQAPTTGYHFSYGSTSNTEGVVRTKKKSKFRKATDDVGRGTKDTGKDVGKGSEKAGEGVAKGTEVGAKATAVAGKDAAKGTAKGAEEVGKVTAKGVKDTGRGIKKIAKD